MADDHLTLRIDKTVKKRFIETARKNGTTASKLLLSFIDDYLQDFPENDDVSERLVEIEKRLEALEQKNS